MFVTALSVRLHPKISQWWRKVIVGSLHPLNLSGFRPLHSQNTCEGDAGRLAILARRHVGRVGYGYEMGRVDSIPGLGRI
jgi:hypothetical protein